MLAPSKHRAAGPRAAEEEALAMVATPPAGILSLRELLGNGLELVTDPVAVVTLLEVQDGEKRLEIISATRQADIILMLLDMASSTGYVDYQSSFRQTLIAGLAYSFEVYHLQSKIFLSLCFHQGHYLLVLV